MKYEDALAYMDWLTTLGWQPGLGRFAELCKRLGEPQDRFKSVHVAGTNGKGSTTAMIAGILRHAGCKTGMYVSPYVYDIRERVQIDGRMISEDDFSRLVEYMIPYAEELGRTEFGHPTEFEVKTALGFLYFAEQNVDLAVLEVGLGGRLDATNVVTPMVSVITSIGLDHTDRLGTTIPEIAFEKAGIVKPNGHLVTAVTDPAAFDVICRVCEERNSILWQVAQPADSVARFVVRPIGRQDRPQTNMVLPASRMEPLRVEGVGRVYDDLEVGMRGEFQYANAATAIGTVEALMRKGIEVPESAIRSGLRDTRMPGRMEIVHRNPTVILDGAHNQSAASALASAIVGEFVYERLILVMGIASGHSVTDVIGTLAPYADVLIATAASNPRAMPAKSIAEAARGLVREIEIVEPVNQAVERALEIASPHDLVLVTGSFYVVGEAHMEHR